MILLIDNYDSFTYNLVHYFGDLGAHCDVVRNDRISVSDAISCGPEAIVISPGPCTPQDAGISIDLVTAAAHAPTPIPLLGVCLGHQAIGAAFGATIVRADLPMHGKVSRITHEGIGLFDGLPGAVDVTRYHSLTIDPDTLSDELQVTARAPDGMIMGVQHCDLPIHGVQFHPESIRTVTGHDMLANFLRLAGMPVRRRNATVPPGALTDGSVTTDRPSDPTSLA